MLPSVSHTRRRANASSARVRVWDTEGNTGVLVYLLLADHRLEIIADRGLRDVDPARWRAVCDAMESRLRAGEPGAAIVAGVEAISDVLAEHAPQTAGRPDRDEIPNRPRFL